MWNSMHINNLKYYAKSIDMPVGICNMHIDFLHDRKGNKPYGISTHKRLEI